VEAVRADNPEFLSVEVQGPVIEVRLTAPSAASARETLDDLLACVRAAERTAMTPAARPKDR